MATAGSSATTTRNACVTSARAASDVPCVLTLVTSASRSGEKLSATRPGAIAKFCAAAYQPASSGDEPSDWITNSPSLSIKRRLIARMNIGMARRQRLAMGARVVVKTGTRAIVIATIAPPVAAARLPSTAPVTDQPASTNTAIATGRNTHLTPVDSARPLKLPRPVMMLRHAAAVVAIGTSSANSASHGARRVSPSRCATQPAPAQNAAATARPSTRCTVRIVEATGRQFSVSPSSFTVVRPNSEMIAHSTVTDTAVATEKRP